MTPRIAVVIVSWNVRDYTVGCVQALMREDPTEKEIIVVDNASSDGTVDALRRNFPQITIFANDKNQGFATAVNQGVKHSRAPIVLLLNPDTQVKPGTLDLIIRNFGQFPDEVSVLAPHLVNERGETIPSVRQDPTGLSQVLILLKIHRLFPRLVSNYFCRDFDYAKEQAVEQVMGAAMAIRRNIFDQLNGFDGTFFLWFDEVDFCKRLRNAGKRIEYVPEIAVIDFAGKSFAQVNAKTRAKYFTDSLNYYAQKHWSKSQQKVIRAAGAVHRLIAKGVDFFKIKSQPRPR